MGEAQRRSYEEQRRIDLRKQRRRTLVPRTFKAIVTFLLIASIFPMAAWAAYEAFSKNEGPWE